MLKNINKEQLIKKVKLSKKSIITNACIIITSIALGTTLLGCGKEKDKNPTTPTVKTMEQENDEIKTLDIEIKTPTFEISSEPEIVTSITEESIENSKLGIEEFNKLVDEVELANNEAGLNLVKENLELAIYINNIDKATPELVEKIESSYNYNEEDMINVYLKTITSYNNDKLEYYNGEDTKSADISLMFTDDVDKNTIKYIDLLFEDLLKNMNSNVESDDTKTEEIVKHMGNVVDELVGYTRKNDEINGYTKDQLTVGGLFTTKLMIDDAFASFATTGYANSYESDISAIAEANFDSMIARTYSILGSKASLVECEEKTLVK